MFFKCVVDLFDFLIKTCISFFYTVISVCLDNLQQIFDIDRRRHLTLVPVYSIFRIIEEYKVPEGMRSFYIFVVEFVIFHIISCIWYVSINIVDFVSETMIAFFRKKK